MGMGDCAVCWDEMCTCGWKFRHWTAAAIDAQIHMLRAVREVRLHKPGLENERDSWLAAVRAAEAALT